MIYLLGEYCLGVVYWCSFNFVSEFFPVGFFVVCENSLVGVRLKLHFVLVVL